MIEILLIILALLASAYFSANEIAFVVANKIKLEVRAKKNIFGAQSAKKLIKNPNEFLTTFLIGNNIANITFASLSGIYLRYVFNLSDFETLIITTTILLIFGEIIPKAITREMADIAILYFSFPNKFIRFILLPLIKLIELIMSIILKVFKQPSSAASILEKEDIKMLLRESEKAGNVQKRESEIINRVINLREQKVYAAMRPRIEIVACDINSTVDQLFEIFIESGYSKIPIYENSIDNIIGVVYHQDLFKKFDSIKEIIKPINFYPETKSSIDLLKEFLEEDVKIGIIIDEYGGTAGMVTSEDLIEELLGEIRDEYDIEENICRKVSENTYLISGRSEIDNVNELLNLNIPAGNYETFSGYIVDRLGKIPNEGEEYIIDDFKVLIVKATPTRIDLVKVITQNQIEE